MGSRGLRKQTWGTAEAGEDGTEMHSMRIFYDSNWSGGEMSKRAFYGSFPRKGEVLAHAGLIQTLKVSTDVCSSSGRRRPLPRMRTTT